MTAPRRHVEVAVVGAGPAGLVLANVLHRAGVAVEVRERASRAEVEQQARAGLIEHRVVEYLREHGLADRLLAEGGRHEWCEFVCLGERMRIPYGDLSGGAGHWVYPQQLLVRDLIAAYERSGGTVRFDCPVLDVDTSGPLPLVRCADEVLEADYVVGCDGPRSTVAQAFPADAAGAVERRYPYDWLTVLAEVDRPVDGIRYALHEAGFAGMMPRTPRLARFYLQVPPEADLSDWTEARIREQLSLRLQLAAGDPELGSVTEVGMLRLRGRVREHVRAGRLLLAGDAAHVLTPSGAKGLNLAVADVADLAETLLRCHRDADGHEDALADYDRRRHQAAWTTQEFSDRLLDLLHLPSGDPAESAFGLRLRRERVSRLAAPGPEGEAFARAYAGAGHLHRTPAPAPA
ncbi:p-hydroxybenzoate 3-monooxygenase [Streptomyces sp. 2132.2]|uniref:FAD-dependent monooxygenase n=1 Tax=Streptomyces sp. 2132.2 TaxID=2485161 RepID=UPI000F484C6A|nr:FAD-dependent monooxygenase [Streptomyces sp. 2132.2]ROQ88852.1 p-hydroxybenzoate 3-monooxygenase [Streptomyces sp. 2132.2]